MFDEILNFSEEGSSFTFTKDSISKLTEDEIRAYHSRCVSKCYSFKDFFMSVFGKFAEKFTFSGISLKSVENAVKGDPSSVIHSRFQSPIDKISQFVEDFVETAADSSVYHFQRDQDPLFGIVRIYILHDDCMMEVQIVTPYCNHSLNYHLFKPEESRSVFDLFGETSVHKIGQNMNRRFYILTKDGCDELCPMPPNSHRAYQMWLEASEQEEDDWALQFYMKAFRQDLIEEEA